MCSPGIPFTHCLFVNQQVILLACYKVDLHKLVQACISCTKIFVRFDLHKACTRLVQGLHKLYPKNFHEIAQGLHKTYTRLPQGLYKTCTRLAQGLHNLYPKNFRQNTCASLSQVACYKCKYVQVACMGLHLHETCANGIPDSVSSFLK